MTDEYIRKKDAIKSVAKHLRDAAEFDHPYAARRISEWKPLAESYLRDAQTVDAVEVVRCHECVHKYVCIYGGSQFYCSYGRRE